MNNRKSDNYMEGISLRPLLTILGLNAIFWVGFIMYVVIQ